MPDPRPAAILRGRQLRSATRRSWRALCGLLALCGAFGSACAEDEGPRERPPTRVQVVTALPERLDRTLTSVGSFESPEMTTIASEVEGRVSSLEIPEGQPIEAGHILAYLDDGEDRATLSVARARLKNARDRLKRLENLRAQSVSSEQAYDDARSEFDAAYGAFNEARTRLAKTTIAAPFAGVLGLRMVNVGQVVQGGTEIVELTQVDPLELRFAVPQRFAADVAVGQRVIGRVGSCGATFEGLVEAIDPRVDPATRSVRLQATVPNPGATLLPGMAVSLRLVVGQIADALVVPQEAIIRQGTKHVVYVLDAENRVESRTVTLGEFSPRGVHLASGLEPGVRVVTAGHQKLRPGSVTAPEPFEPVDNPNLALGDVDPEGRCDPPA